MDLKAYDLDMLYRRAIYNVLNSGVDVVARGLPFKELQFSHLTLMNPRTRLITNDVRKISRKFLFAEFIWMMAGHGFLDSIEFYNKRMRNFSDDGIALHGAYGPRLRNWDWGKIDQLKSCLERLKKDLYTRQAVIVILNPTEDFIQPTKDIPCNDLLQFICRNNQLDLCCYVRSNDLNWGFPYDVFHWTMLQEIFALELGVQLGKYHHFVGSLHIYEKDYSFLREVLSGKSSAELEMEPMPLSTKLDIIEKLDLAEKKFREEGLMETSNLPRWWEDLFKWLKS